MKQLLYLKTSLKIPKW